MFVLGGMCWACAESTAAMRMKPAAPCVKNTPEGSVANRKRQARVSGIGRLSGSKAKYTIHKSDLVAHISVSAS